MFVYSLMMALNPFEIQKIMITENALKGKKIDSLSKTRRISSD